MHVVNPQRVLNVEALSVHGTQYSQSISKPSAYALIVVLCISVTVRILGFLMPEYERFFAAFGFFSTFVHEEFHCLSAYLVKGECLEFTVRPNFSGTAWVRTGYGDTGLAISSAAGLLAPAIVGSFLMVFGSNPAYRIACWLSLILLVAVSLFFIKGSFAMGATIVMILVLLLVGACGAQAQYFLINVTGTQLHLASFDDWHYMFSPGFTRDGVYRLSDSQNIANAFEPHSYLFWGGAVAAFSIVLLILSVRAALKNLGRQIA